MIRKYTSVLPLAVLALGGCVDNWDGPPPIKEHTVTLQDIEVLKKAGTDSLPVLPGSHPISRTP